MAFILGNEGKGSLLSYLRRKLWAIDLDAGDLDLGIGSNSLFSIFSISVTLTDDGLEHLDDVLEAIFSFVQYLHRSGPNEQFFRELQSIESNSFRFAKENDATDNVKKQARNIKLYPPKHILTGGSLYFEYDADVLQTILDHLNTMNFNIMITSTRPYDKDVTYDLREEWCGTEYSERPMPEKWIALWNNPRTFKELHMPEPNPYIADDFTIFYDGNQEVPKYPVKLMDTDVCELWYRQDDKFLLPDACLYFYFMTPQALSSVKK